LYTLLCHEVAWAPSGRQCGMMECQSNLLQTQILHVSVLQGLLQGKHMLAGPDAQDFVSKTRAGIPRVARREMDNILVMWNCR
jgi:hypothetical protein